MEAAMQALQVFNFKGTDVRTVAVDGAPWWVAKDVCEVLGIKDHRSAVRNLRGYEKGEHSMPTPSGTQGMTVISESGLYKLILKSRLPSAEAFQDWVTVDVLPSIRQTGSYAVAAMPANRDDKLDTILAMLAGKTLAMAEHVSAVEVTANDAKILAAAAPAAALAAMNVEQADRADLRRDLMKATEALVDEALKRGFFDGNRRAAFIDINRDLRDRFGVRDAMPSDRLRLALAYVNDRHTKLTDPNRLPFSG